MNTTAIACEGREKGLSGPSLAAYIQRQMVLLTGRPVSAYEVNEAIKDSNQDTVQD